MAGRECQQLSSRLEDLIGKFMPKQFLGSKLCDIFVPWAAQENEAQKKRRLDREGAERSDTELRIANADEAVLETLQADFESLLESNEDRQRSVDSRLSTIVGLSSIAGTITTGVIIAQAAGTMNFPLGFWRWGLSAIALYLVVQLCDAIHWAIRGQERQSYLGNSIQGVLPELGVNVQDFQRKRILNTVSYIQANREAVNAKVTAMAVAHRAAKNFVVGLLAMSVVGVFMMREQHKAPSILETLRTDASLLEMLKGPAGPQGPPGLKGEPGKQGIQGIPGTVSISNKSASSQSAKKKLQKESVPNKK